jgi:hypothetical protein
MRWVSEKDILIYVIFDEFTMKALDYAFNDVAAQEIGAKYALALHISVKVVKFKSVGSCTF